MHAAFARTFLATLALVTLSVVSPAQPAPIDLDVSTLDGKIGLALRGVAERDECGKAVAPAGDVNDDGFDDLILGAPLAWRDGSNMVGESYVVFGTGGVHPARLELSTLDGSNGFTLLGARFGDFSGMAVSTAGDVNFDGISDVLVGAGIASPARIPEAGEAYVVFGSRAGFPAALALADLDGSIGFDVEGLAPPDRMGSALASAGDLNGDGIDDMVFGALGASPDGKSFAGESYVVFGTPGLREVSLSALDGSNGFVLRGILEGERSGAAVQSAGDVNGDGIDDLILGAPMHRRPDASRVGAAFVLFGSKARFPAVVQLGALNGDNGFIVDGVQAGDICGSAVAGALDLNADGLDDVLIGCPNAWRDDSQRRGEVLVVYGRRDAFPARIDAGYYDGARGFRMAGAEIDDFGFSVAAAGDVNDDGIDDAVIGAPRSSPGERRDAGAAYVVYGRRDPFAAVVRADELDTTGGMRIVGAHAEGRLGWSVASAGDANDDDIADLVVGAPFVSPDGRQRVGEAYVVFGRSADEVPVLLQQLSAVETPEGVLLGWTLAGALHRDWSLRIQRATNADGPYVTVHRQWVGTERGSTYLDPETQHGTSWYRVALVDKREVVRAALRVQVSRRDAQRSTVLHAPQVEADGNVLLPYAIADAAQVRLTIYDARGRRVHAFAPSYQPAGQHVRVWSHGRQARSTGVFWVELRAGSRREARRLVLLAR